MRLGKERDQREARQNKPAARRPGLSSPPALSQGRTASSSTDTLSSAFLLALLGPIGPQEEKRAGAASWRPRGSDSGSEGRGALAGVEIGGGRGAERRACERGPAFRSRY